MIGALIWTAVGVGVIVASGATVRATSEIHGRRRYARTLANIERLDRELGLGDYSVSALTDTTETLGREIDRAYRAKVGEDPPYSEWIIDRCAGCGRRVALNAGTCHGYRGTCAKSEWRAREWRRQRDAEVSRAVSEAHARTRPAGHRTP